MFLEEVDGDMDDDEDDIDDEAILDDCPPAAVLSWLSWTSSICDHLFLPKSLIVT